MSLQTLARHGITSQTVENFIIDAGAVYFFNTVDKETPANWSLLGATRDGNSFSVEQDVREMPIDGVKGPLKGARRIIRVMPQIVANLIEMSTASFLRALPGADAADWPTVSPTHDQITRALEIALADYIENLALVGTVNGRDEPFVGIIKNGLADQNLEISTSPNDESGLAVTFTGHFDPSDVEEEPWEILYPKAPSS